MADFYGLPSNQWSAADLGRLHQPSDFAPLPAMHDVQDVSFSHRIIKPKSIRFSCKFTTSATASFEPGEHRTTEYVTKRKQVIDYSLGHISNKTINWLKSSEDVQL
jgi:spore coat protein U-like protein